MARKRRLIFRWYGRTTPFLWVVRFNIVVMRDIQSIEWTCGLFGRGVLVLFYYGPDRMREWFDAVGKRKAVLENTSSEMDEL